MPKRSNDFQRLVTIIHEAIAATDGAKVTESAMVAEPDGTLREVDILLERRLADVHVRLAIECRDRSRKSDVDWIDGLVGKLKNLQVDKVIAVCRRGFSKAATAKAKDNKIELRTLSQCLANEWTGEFIKLGFAAFQFTPTLDSFEITFEPELTEPITLKVPARTPAVSTPITLETIVQSCFLQNVVPRIKEHVDKEFLSKGPPLAELTRKWEFSVPVDIRDVLINTPAGHDHQVKAMLFNVRAESVATTSTVGHFRYGDTAVASVGCIDFGAQRHAMKVVQVAGSNKLSVNISKRDTGDA